MNDDRSGGAPPDSEAETVQPNKVSGDWEMPEPKFQQTSGYLPQGYLEKLGLDSGAGTAAAPALSQPEPPGIEVEPQPDLSEQIAEPPAAMTPGAPAKQKNTAGRVMLLLLGLAGMIVFIAAFLAVVWYFFLRPADGGSPF